MTKRGKGKYRRLTYEDRIRIETLYNSGFRVVDIAKKIGFAFTGIYRELKKGFYTHKNSDWTYTKKYSAYKAHQRMLFERTTKGAQLKIGNDREYLNFIEDKIIKEKLSPEAVLAFIKRNNLKFKTTICKATLYSYIDKGLFQHLTNKDLPIKAEKRNKYKKVRSIKKITTGKTIEERKPEILTREEFGHWELDTVIGRRKKDYILYVLTERKTRQEIIVKGKDKSTLSCITVLNKLERKYGKAFRKLFKTITCDNGCEFANWVGMEKSCLSKNSHPRTQVYYCHPYSSWERGSNENQNRLIRRFIPKGKPISNYTNDQIQQIEDYINNYPRKIFNYRTSAELFEEELRKIS